MSSSDDFFLEAAVPAETVYQFLSHDCGLAVGDNDLHGKPIYYCDEFRCFTSELNDIQKGSFAEHLGFTPHIRLECYIMTIPHVDCHPRLIDLLELLILKYDGGVAWLTECSIPQLVKLEDRVLVQGDVSPYSQWADFLKLAANKIGLPYEVVKLPPC